MFNLYQQEAAKTFKEHISPLEALTDWTLGLCGEAGEVAELVKHITFHGEPIDMMKMVSELGDVYWYLNAIATELGVNFEDVAAYNLAKLNHRYQGAFSKEQSAQRIQKEVAFQDTPLYKILEAKLMNKPNPLFVIFIGPDGSGKSTIADSVHAKLPGFTFYKGSHNNGLGEEPLDSALTVLNTSTNVICDRFHWPDDMVYRRLHDTLPEDCTKEAAEYWSKNEQVATLLRKCNPVFFYVTAPLEILVERSRNWKDDYVKQEQLPRLIQLYKHVESKLIDKLPFYTIDTMDVHTGTPAYYKQIDDIVEIIQCHQENYELRMESP